MDTSTIFSRLQFAFTISFHYLFPQFTMGLALLLVILKVLFLWRKDERFNTSARFWGKLLAITFVFGVVTGIPMEFQFGTNWARFSPSMPGILSRKHWLWRAHSRSFLSQHFWEYFCLASRSSGKKCICSLPSWSGWVHGLPVVSSSRQTHGCSIRLATQWPRMDACTSPITGRCCSIPGLCRSICIQ